MAVKSEQIQIRVTRREKAALRRLAAAAGQDLSSYLLACALPPARRRFEELVAALADEENRRFALAELNDLLTGMSAAELGEAVTSAELTPLSPLVRNYVAAMVEQAAAAKGIDRPAWTAAVAPLERPYFAAPLASLRPHLLAVSPVPFKRRNLFVDSTLGARV